MAGTNYKLRFWGARGTVPTPAASRLRYGGNTSCLTLSLSEHEHLIFDCGSGLRAFGASLPANPERRERRFHVFFSHYHFDHVEGFPLFAPLYEPSARITVHGRTSGGMGTQEVLETLIRPPYFPVTLADVPSQLDYADARATPKRIGDITIDSIELNHPGGCLAYRLRRGDRTIVYATDHEHGIEEKDDALVEFAHGADHLIYDATYEPGEYEEMRKGWGHSTWYAAVRTAVTAGVKNLVLFHHHPDHSDDELDRVRDVAREEFPHTEVSHEGLELLL